MSKCRDDIIIEIRRSLHELTRNDDRLTKINESYYTTDGNDRKCVINYIKSIIDDKEILNIILSDEYLDEDNPNKILEKAISEIKSGTNIEDKNLLQLLADIKLGNIEIDNGEYGELIDTLSKDEYVLIYDDSDGERIWYKTAPSEEIVKYLYKNEHRKCIGCGCNQYIHMIIKDKKSINIRDFK